MTEPDWDGFGRFMDTAPPGMPPAELAEMAMLYLGVEGAREFQSALADVITESGAWN